MARIDPAAHLPARPDPALLKIGVSAARKTPSTIDHQFPMPLAFPAGQAETCAFSRRHVGGVGQGVPQEDFHGGVNVRSSAYPRRKL